MCDHRVHPAGEVAKAGINIETLKRFRRPPNGGLHTWRKRRRELLKLLAPDVEIILSTRRRRSGRNLVASWLADAGERERIAREPASASSPAASPASW